MDKWRNSLNLKNILLFFTLIIFLDLCFNLRNNNFVPNTDFFSYISDGNNILHGKLPYQLKLPPVYSILISVPRLFFNNHFIELNTGIVLNILFMFLFLILIYRFVNKIDLDFGLPVVILLATNFLTIKLAIQPINFALFSLLVALVLYLDLKGKTRLSIFLAGFGYLVRPEAIVLTLILLIKSLFNGRINFKENKNYLLVISLIPMIMWELFTHVKNAGGNSYLVEVQQRIPEIPNWRFLFYSFHHFLFFPNNIPVKISVLLMLTLITVSYFVFLKNKQKILFTLFLFSWFYTLIHFVFPGFGDRYSYPLLILNYLSILAPIAYLYNKNIIGIAIKRVLLFIIVIFFSYQNISSISSLLNFDKYYRFENILFADYLNSTPFPKKTIAVTLEPWIVQYYLNNSNVNVVSVPNGCTSIECLRNDKSISHASEFLVVLDNYNTATSNTDYFTTSFGGKFFVTFNKQQGMQPIYVKKENNKWIKVYRIVNH